MSSQSRCRAIPAAPRPSPRHSLVHTRVLVALPTLFVPLPSSSSLSPLHPLSLVRQVARRIFSAAAALRRVFEVRMGGPAGTLRLLMRGHTSMIRGGGQPPPISMRKRERTTKAAKCAARPGAPGASLFFICFLLFSSALSVPAPP
ncbi:hypothetical protein C8R44DRAFT_987119 [Mycena epipterygia]|nr:hypothetical protein C8R44DRAFT_987119 [Mycena epipterygia]